MGLHVAESVVLLQFHISSGPFIMAILVKLRLIAPLTIRKTNSIVSHSRAAMSTVIKEKLAFFEDKQFDWWDVNGKCRPLHMFVPFRMDFIIRNLENQSIIKKKGEDKSKILDGLNILDVGCGVGITAERMASLGANVIGIDPSKVLIDEANKHLLMSSAHLTSQLTYLVSTAEEHVLDSSNIDKYDVISVFMILEHIQHRKLFIQNCIRLLKPGGSLFIHTANRNWLSVLWINYYHTYVTGFIPKNALQYSRLVSAKGLQSYLYQSGCKSVSIEGFGVSASGKTLKWRKFNPSFRLIHAVKA
ncbi:Hexaprenyldihydroxybenzoate methyltransferase, mitochondrial [Chamberlinius hualienensis]